MILHSLKADSFRNLSRLSITDFGKTNLVIGSNGSGKTNLIEALSMLSSVRPLRKVHFRDLIRWHSHYFYLRGDYDDGTVSLGFDGHRKVLKLNEDPFPISKLELQNPSVAFLPSDLDILTGSPSIRRGFLNTALSKSVPDYRKTLLSYNQVLKQRNSQLKLNPKQVALWNSELIRWGSELIVRRKEMCDILSKELAVLYQTLYGIPVELIYHSNIHFDGSVEENFLRALEVQKNREFYAKYTLVGPHRDNFDILSNEKTSSLFASQGQTRALVIALKLSVAKLIESRSNIRPLLLIDDALLELDEQRRSLLLNFLFPHYQIVLTLTSEKVLSDIPEGTQVYHLQEGSLIKV